MNKVQVLGSVALALALGGCSQSQPTAPKFGEAVSPTTVQASATLPTSATGTADARTAGSVKGAGGEMPAYYDGELFTINSVELSDVAGDRIGSNPGHNEIYVTNDLDDEQDFIPVLDAVPGDEFNPLWEQFLIVFNQGVTPRQFFSDDEVEDAAAGPHPDITLVDTHEVYRCSVVATK